MGLQALDQPFHLVDRSLIDLRYAGLTSSIASNPVEALNLESAPCVDRVKVNDQRFAGGAGFMPMVIYGYQAAPQRALISGSPTPLRRSR